MVILQGWKNPLLYISGIGISNLGNWIYLVAINLLVLDMTGSPAAVAALFVIRPIAVLLTNSWSGGIIDRANKRTLMIGVDLARGVLVAAIPLLDSIWAIYGVMFMISMAGAFFGPGSMVYVTKLIAPEQRKRFNAWTGFASSGAALVGPAVSGLLIMYFSTTASILINAASFLVCAFLISLLPDVDQRSDTSVVTSGSRGFAAVGGDWKAVFSFARSAPYFMTIYLLFQTVMMLSFALDSQEATFIIQVIGLADRDYGLLVSVAGAGYLAGSACAAFVSGRVPLRMYISAGVLLSSAGYALFYSASGILAAAIGFIVFGFFSSFANAGYTTFYQNSVPVGIMGRFGSIASLLEGGAQIALTLLLGAAAEIFRLQTVSLIAAGLAIAVSIVLFAAVYSPGRRSHYEAKTEGITAP